MENFIGFVLPPFIDLINTKVPNSKLRFWISLVACLFIAVLFNLNKLDWKDVLASGAIIFSEAQVVYKQYWQESKFRESLQSKLA